MERDKYYFRKVPVNQKYEKVYSVQQQMTAVGTAPKACSLVKLYRSGHQSMQRNSLRHGVALFNRAHFFDAHEVLEDVWRSVPRDCASRRHLRLHLQGMVQLAVAFHHQSTGNHVGARSVLERAMRNLNGAESSFPDLDLERLRAELAPWRQHLDESKGASERKLDGRDIPRHDVLNGTAPALPKIMKRR